MQTVISYTSRSLLSPKLTAMALSTFSITGAVAVAGVVLHDQHRADAALLAADHRAQIGIVYLPAFYIGIHSCSHSEAKSTRVDGSGALFHGPWDFIPRDGSFRLRVSYAAVRQWVQRGKSRRYSQKVGKK